MVNIYLHSPCWEKLTLSKLRFFRFKEFVSRSVFGKLQLTQVTRDFEPSCCNLKIRGLRKNRVRLFSIYVSFLRHLMRHLSLFHMKDTIYYEESLIFLTRFYSHLWLLGRYIDPTLKKYCLLNLDLAWVQNGQYFDWFFWGETLVSISRASFNYVFINLSNVKNVKNIQCFSFIKKNEAIFSKRVLFEPFHFLEPAVRILITAYFRTASSQKLR